MAPQSLTVPAGRRWLLWQRAVARQMYFMARPLFREIFGPKDLPDLNGVAFVRRAALRPLHDFFL